MTAADVLIVLTVAAGVVLCLRVHWQRWQARRPRRPLVLRRPVDRQLAAAERDLWFEEHGAPKGTTR